MFEEINYADGVLDVEMHDERAYVLNKQTPNKQIWLSSPLSGPQRFEFDSDKDKWFQIRSGDELVSQLEREFNEHFKAGEQSELHLKI